MRRLGIRWSTERGCERVGVGIWIKCVRSAGRKVVAEMAMLLKIVNGDDDTVSGVKTYRLP